MKGFIRNAMSILMTLMVFCAVLGSRGMSVSARAEELNNENNEILSEIPEDPDKDADGEEIEGKILEGTGEEAQKEMDKEPSDETQEGKEPGAEAVETDKEVSDAVETDKAAAGAAETKAAPAERMYDVCFFIRGSRIGADIPREPALHFSEQYSSAIRVNGAVSASSYKPSSREQNGSEEALLTDGFTASNEVSTMLNALPSASDIKSVVSDFDQSRHYVVWYVIKSATTGYPNTDVTIHVDGVIRERTEIIDPGEDPETEDPVIEDPEEIVDPIPDVTLEIRALFLEDGKECKEIIFDGKEHIVGGFEIVVHDKESGNPIIGYLYECYGKFLGTKAYADVGAGTEFMFRGEEFWVNVVKAFAKVTNPGDSQEVVFYDANDNPLRTAADFIIRDSSGNVLPTKFNVVPTTGNVSVKARDITIEAGTTVRNNEGQTLTNDTYSITSGSLIEGHSIQKVVINGSQTGAGKSVNEISSIIIVDEKGNNVNHLYNIKRVNGQLILVDPNGTETKVSKGSEADLDSKTVSIISVKKTDTGVTETTGNVILKSIEAAGDASSSAQVLGARRADTSDQAGSDLRILLMTLCFAGGLIILKNGKHTN